MPRALIGAWGFLLFCQKYPLKRPAFIQAAGYFQLIPGVLAKTADIC